MFYNKNLIVVVIAIFLILCVLKDDTSKLMVGIGTLFFLYKNGFTFKEGLDGVDVVDTVRAEGTRLGFKPELGSQKNTIIGNNTVTSKGAKPGKVVKAPTVNTGPYDGLCLKTGNDEYWMKSPDETSLVPNDTLYTYLSSQGPIKMKLSDQAALSGPPVDGVAGSFEKKFMFANNVASPLCCPSTLSTSPGCVCTTPNPRDYIAGRGAPLTLGGGAKEEV
jgi:hypothetical protein